MTPIRALSLGLLLAAGCTAGSVAGHPDDAEHQGDGDVTQTDVDQTTDDALPGDGDGDGDPIVSCPLPEVHEATGTTRELHPGTALATLLSQSAAGDRVRVFAGNYPAEQITATFASDVFIEAAAGAAPSFAGLRFVASAHVVMRGIAFTDTLILEGSHDFLLEHVSIDLGTEDASALQIDGQQSSGASHHITVTDSSIRGGARTVFFLGSFAPSDTWNHHVVFARNDFVCGSHNCFQLSGARDTEIVDNLFHDPLNTAVLTAGATRITIARNRMIGDPDIGATAIQLATPGEWDPYTGNQHMISSDIVVADNLIVGWGGPGISLHAATGIDIVNNTVTTAVGLSTWHRIPHDTGGNVILTGNTEVRLWNNILTTIQLDTGDSRPVFESHNLVRSGGAGDHLITTEPRFVDTVSYGLAADSPAIDAGIAADGSPAQDLVGNTRDATPDLGAVERNGQPPACP